MPYQVKTHTLAPSDWPIEWVDAELCAALCRFAPRIDWDTVRFKRLPSGRWNRHDVIVATATASG